MIRELADLLPSDPSVERRTRTYAAATPGADGQGMWTAIEKRLVERDGLDGMAR